MRQRTHSRLSRGKNRRGVEVLELILVLPVLVVALVALVQFGIAMVVHQAVTTAAGAAAREASKQADILVVRDAVDRILSPHNIQILNTPGSGTKVMLDDGALGTTSFGDAGLSCIAHGNAPAANEVRVTVCIDLAKAKVPNALASFGLDFAGKRFETSATVRKE